MNDLAVAETAATQGLARPPDRFDRFRLAWLITAAAATVVLWQLPIGNYILYPFTILSTWFHEMGHGMAAIVVGGDFEKLLIYSDGSGMAMHSGTGSLATAWVAAGGPLGPAVAGAGLILASRRAGMARPCLFGLGGALLFSVVAWVRSWFGVAFVSLLGLAILAVAVWGHRWLRGFTVQFLGVQACVSMFRQLDYLFTKNAVIGGRTVVSDSGQIAANLLLPYWFWGGAMTLTAVALLVQSLYLAYRPHPESPRS